MRISPCPLPKLGSPGDVRDRDALAEAFQNCDVVVHLAFMITGNAALGVLTGADISRELGLDATGPDAG